jgi:hypothetical protein
MFTITPLIDTLKLEKIDDATYFSKKYKNYISNSRLSLIDPTNDGSPKKFFEDFGSISIYSDSIRMGSAVHELALQPESFVLCTEVDTPTAKLGYVCEWLYEHCKEVDSDAIIKASDAINYYKGKMTKPRIENVRHVYSTYKVQRDDFTKKNTDLREVVYCGNKMQQQVQDCLTALNKDKNIQNLLHPKDIFGQDLTSEMEQAILLDIRVDSDEYDSFILKLKAKLDNYTIDELNNTICVNDIKTAGTLITEFENNFYKFRYYRELAIYCWLLSLCAKKYYNMDNPTITSNCLVVSTILDHYTRVYKVTSKDFRKGWNEFQKLLQLIAFNVATKYKDFGIWI